MTDVMIAKPNLTPNIYETICTWNYGRFPTAMACRADVVPEGANRLTCDDAQCVSPTRRGFAASRGEDICGKGVCHD